MNSRIQQLLQVLDLERIELDVFRGTIEPEKRPRVFGGLVLGQSLIAAGRTVTDRRAHSLQAYFLRAGDVKANILYTVERLRDGTSFSARRVTAIQHGRPIFVLSASFQVDEEGVSHQDEMPEVPGPEGLESMLDQYRAAQHLLPERMRDMFTSDRPFDIRSVQQIDFSNPGQQPARRDLWLRAHEHLPDDPLIHQALLAYVSDSGLLGTALLPHDVSFLTPGLQMASLDHAMWFHRPFRVDDWVLYTTQSPSASGSRGLSRGAMFSRDGTQIASVAQEGLIRLRKT